MPVRPMLIMRHGVLGVTRELLLELGKSRGSRVDRGPIGIEPADRFSALALQKADKLTTKLIARSLNLLLKLKQLVHVVHFRIRGEVSILQRDLQIDPLLHHLARCSLQLLNGFTDEPAIRPVSGLPMLVDLLEGKPQWRQWGMRLSGWAGQLAV